MKEKIGCPQQPSFYLVVVTGMILGFIAGGEVSKNDIVFKILGMLAFGFMAGVLAVGGCGEDLNAAGCPQDKPYPITEFGGKWTGECSDTIVLS